MGIQRDIEAVYAEHDRQLGEAMTKVSQLQQQVATLTADKAALQAQLTEAQAKVCPDPSAHEATPEPTPEPAGVMLGMSYKSGEDPKPGFEDRLGTGPITIRRHFTSSMTPTSAVNAVKGDIANGRKLSQVSHKPSVSWASAATGGMDAAAVTLADALKAAKGGATHRIQCAVNHEPENDTGTNTGSTVAGRDQWVGMQKRLSPIYRQRGLEYGVILMGYHSVPNAGGNFAVWGLDKLLPLLAGHIDFIGFDIYEAEGEIRTDGTMQTKPRDFAGWLGYIGAECGKVDLEWGLSETGITEQGFQRRPNWFTEIPGLVGSNGGSFFAYFNTTLSSSLPTTGQTWYLEPGSPEETAFANALKA